MNAATQFIAPGICDINNAYSEGCDAFGRPDKWQLLYVPLSKINFEKWNNSKYENNKKIISQTNTVLPVIIEEENKENKYELRDGNHRCFACNELGYTHILAYVPTTIDTSDCKIFEDHRMNNSFMVTHFDSYEKFILFQNFTAVNSISVYYPHDYKEQQPYKLIQNYLVRALREDKLIINEENKEGLENIFWDFLDSYYRSEILVQAGITERKIRFDCLCDKNHELKEVYKNKIKNVSCENTRKHIRKAVNEYNSIYDSYKRKINNDPPFLPKFSKLLNE